MNSMAFCLALLKFKGCSKLMSLSACASRSPIMLLHSSRNVIVNIHLPTWFQVKVNCRWNVGMH